VSGSLTDDGTYGRGSRLSLSPRTWTLLIGFLCAALLALPGITITTKSLDELFWIVEGIDRILKGQVPNVDFHTNLGPLVYYVPALGYRLTGSVGGAMPATMAFFVVVMTLISSHVLISRLRPYLALLFAVFLLLILAAPMNLGEGVTGLSFAMFYNRIGWVAIALLLAMYLRPRPGLRRQTALDAVSAVILTLIMIYTRATYGLVALVFLLFMLTDRHHRLWAGTSILLVAAMLVIVGMIWGGSSAYVADVWLVMQANGLLGRGPGEFLQRGLAHIADLLLLAFLVILTLSRTWRWRDLIFFLFCAIGGLWLLSHDIQRWGVITVHAAAAVAAERLLRQMDDHPETGQGAFVNWSGVKLYFLAFVLPTILHCGMALALYAGAATARAGQPVALPHIEGVHIADLWTGGDFNSASWYLGTIEEGLGLLAALDQPIHQLSVPGAANIFSRVLDLQPAGGDVTQMRWDVTVNETHFIPPEDLFAHADTVLLWRTGEAAEGVARLYLPFLQQNFTQAGESEHWTLFHRPRPDMEQTEPSPG